MTSTERAERILQQFNLTNQKNAITAKQWNQLYRLIAAQIEEAERGSCAGMISLELHQKIVLDRMAFSFAAAREKAKGIAETPLTYEEWYEKNAGGNPIAARISKMEADA